MRILHLLSQTHLTGPEVYVAALCRKQMADGHECFIISDTLTVKSVATYIPMSIHNRSLLSRVRNIAQVAAFCRREKIDIINAHSRAASWIANGVVKMVDVGYVSTIHGRQSQRAIKRGGNVYGRNIIVVCEHLLDHVCNELKIHDANIQVIRNGFD